MDRDELLAAAKAATAKVRLEEYREVVQELRGKGFTWREVADFLTERGVTTDHTWVYRTFGKKKKTPHVESRPVEISRARYVGTRETKSGAWNLVEIELPSTLGQPIPVVAFYWAKGAARLELGDESSVTVRDAILVTKSGVSFPMAYIKAELQAVGDDQWSPQEMYILPKWEVLIAPSRPTREAD